MKIKSNEIYLFKFIKVVDVDSDDEKEFEHPIYNEISNCLNEEEINYIGFTDNEDIFARIPEYKIQLMSKIFTKWGFEFELSNVTQSVKKGIIQKEYPEVEELTPQLFEDFRYENTTIDDVLDKIIEMGIDSLDEIDKSILK